MISFIAKRFSQVGRLFTWGDGSESIGYSKKISSPQQVKLPQLVKKVEMGNRHSAAIGVSGKVYIFGENVNGSLGVNRGDLKSMHEPQQIQFFTKNNLKVADVVCGYKHTFFLTENGDVWTCGYGGRKINPLLRIFISSSGCLGHGDNKHRSAPTPIQYFRKCKPMKKISGGKYFGISIDEQGKMYNWGIGEYGVFGNGQNKNLKVPELNDYYQYAKSKEGGQLRLARLKSAQNYTVAVTQKGEAYAWGGNQYGQIGVKSQIGIQLFQTVNFMSQIQELKGKEIQDFAVGQDVSIYLTKSKEVFWTGFKIAYKPQKLQLPEGVVPRLVACSYRCFGVVDQKNNVYSRFRFLKSDLKGKQDAKTGIECVSGDEVFKGRILQIGGKHRNCYAIVE